MPTTIAIVNGMKNINSPNMPNRNASGEPCPFFSSIPSFSIIKSILFISWINNGHQNIFINKNEISKECFLSFFKMKYIPQDSNNMNDPNKKVVAFPL